MFAETRCGAHESWKKLGRRIIATWYSRWWFQIFVIFAPYLGKISNLTNIFQLLVKHSFKDFFFLSPPSIGCLLRVLVFCVHEYSSGARVPGYRLICWYGAWPEQDLGWQAGVIQEHCARKGKTLHRSWCEERVAAASRVPKSSVDPSLRQVVANIQMRTLKAEVEKGSMWTAICKRQVQTSFQFCPHCGKANNNYDEIQDAVSKGARAQGFKRKPSPLCDMEHALDFSPSRKKSLTKVWEISWPKSIQVLLQAPVSEPALEHTSHSKRSGAHSSVLRQHPKGASDQNGTLEWGYSQRDLGFKHFDEAKKIPGVVEAQAQLALLAEPFVCLSHVGRGEKKENRAETDHPAATRRWTVQKPFELTFNLAYLAVVE